MEEWRQVPSVPGLLSSSAGRILCEPMTLATPQGVEFVKTFKPWLGSWNKTTKRFGIRFRGKNYRVACLVAEAFHGPRPDKAVCMHLNEDARDNRSENLAWGTQRQNLNAPGFISYCCTRTGENSPTTKGRRGS